MEGSLSLLISGLALGISLGVAVLVYTALRAVVAQFVKGQQHRPPRRAPDDHGSGGGGGVHVRPGPPEPQGAPIYPPRDPS